MVVYWAKITKFKIYDEEGNLIDNFEGYIESEKKKGLGILEQKIIKLKSHPKGL